MYTPRVSDDTDGWHRGDLSRKKRAMSIDDIAMSSAIMLAAESAALANKENDSNKTKKEEYNGQNHSNGKGRSSPAPSDKSDDNTPIIPWRAQLRKTNSRLSLID